MKKMSNEKRLPFLIIFAGITYIFLILSTIKNESDDFLSGFMTGYQQEGSKQLKNKTNQIPPDVYFLHVKPKSGVFSFPDTLINTKTGEKTGTRYFEMRAAVPFNTPKPSFVSVYEGIKYFLSFFVLVVYIYIPILFFKLMNSLKKEIVFDQSNIKKIKNIGKSLIVIFLVNEAYTYLSLKINQAQFDFSNYEIIREKADYIWLLVGVVTMIIAEIVLRGMELKKEQELTI